MKTNRNLAARAGRWSALHRKRAIWGWLAFVLLAVVIGSAIGTKDKELKQSEYGVGESGRAEKALHQSFQTNYAERVMVQMPRGRVESAAGRSAVTDVIQRLDQTGKATHVVSPFTRAGHGQVSKDGRSALITFEIAGTAGDDAGELLDRVDPLLAATQAAQRAHPQVRIEQFGQASVAKAFSKSISDDFARATRAGRCDRPDRGVV